MELLLAYGLTFAAIMSDLSRERGGGGYRGHDVKASKWEGNVDIIVPRVVRMY